MPLTKDYAAIEPEQVYTIPDAMKLTGLSYEDICAGLDRRYLKFRKFNRTKEKHSSPFETGTILVEEKSLLDFVKNDKCKKYSPLTRRQRHIVESNAENCSEEQLERRMTACPRLSYDEETKLLKRMKRGDLRARNDLIESNSGLVMKYLTNYFGHYRDGLDFDDLVQEGMIGLIVGIDKYRLSRLNKKNNQRHNLSTYAMWWIMQSIPRAIYEKGQTIRRPINKVEIEKKIKRMVKEHTIKFGKEPDISEIQRKTKVPEETIKSLAYLAHGDIISLDRTINEDEDLTLQDTFPDGHDMPAEAEANCRMIKFMEIAQTFLDPVESEIVYRRAEGEDFKEIGEKVGLPVEKVKNATIRSIRRIRGNRKIRNLFEIN